MTEAAIDSNVLRDVFVALGEPLGDNAWSVRLRVKPLIGLLWLGSGLMALGGLVAVTDRRYRVAVRKTEPATAQPAPGAA
jgi:cytochrome c-type biogenesis protein CcmF